MTKPTTEEFAELVEKIGEMMPQEISTDHLISFILTVLHSYFEVDQVPRILRKLADACEHDAENIKRMLDDVAEES